MTSQYQATGSGSGSGSILPRELVNMFTGFLLDVCSLAHMWSSWLRIMAVEIKRGFRESQLGAKYDGGMVMSKTCCYRRK